ncbi:glycosyltransferase [Kineococcus gypseus]|uniref:glycosyltransferase n=1 Tax=Kineococcus gypseus TaxID=1637102 RepID=UPI003D7C38C7
MSTETTPTSSPAPGAPAPAAPAPAAPAAVDRADGGGAARPRAGRRPAVLVYNTDGVNPYGAEIASLLSRRGLVTTLLDPGNSGNRPADGVRWRRALPENFGSGSGARQLASLARGLGETAWASLVRRRVVLVSFTRFPVEDLVLAGLGALGRPVALVVHNPVPRQAESTPARWARLALLRSASTVVVHAERLRAKVHPAVRGPVRVCPHPPYAQTVAAGEPQLSLDPQRRWVAFLGALRWDKGIDLVPEVLERVPEEQRRRLGLVVCGRGELPAATWEHLRELGVAVHDLTSPDPVPQEVLLDVLRNRPLLLAPYVAATQSGSVVLALSAGCRVLAFDEGGIPDVLTADGLVPNGDVEAMARALAEGRGGTAREPLERWTEQAARAWAGVVEDLG